MEHSDTPQYLPLSSRRKADALASAEQLGLLARHIETTLLDLAHELRDGSITADPYFRSGQDTACTHQNIAVFIRQREHGSQLVQLGNQYFLPDLHLF